MRVVVLQPGYLPWLGFFEQMCKSDVFVVYDDVQYDKHGWRNRNRIKTAQGAQWLTIPVLTKGQDKPLVKDVRINNQVDWRKSHFRSIIQNYSRAPFYDIYIGMFQEIYSKEWEYLLDIDMAFIFTIKGWLGLTTRIEFSSKLGITGERTQRLVDMCLKLGANEFLEGSAGRSYLVGDGEQLFAQNGIKLIYQDYQHPIYHQLYGDFISHLSVIDLLFNHGDKSLDIIKGVEL